MRMVLASRERDATSYRSVPPPMTFHVSPSRLVVTYQQSPAAERALSHRFTEGWGAGTGRALSVRRSAHCAKDRKRSRSEPRSSGKKKEDSYENGGSRTRVGRVARSPGVGPATGRPRGRGRPGAYRRCDAGSDSITPHRPDRLPGPSMRLDPGTASHFSPVANISPAAPVEPS